VDALAQHLRDLRHERGLSLVQLAQATGISSSFLSLLEQGRSDVTIGRLIRVAEFYDVDLADLLAGGRTEPPDDVHVLRASEENMLRSETEGVDLYELAAGARWTLVAMLGAFQPGGKLDVPNEHAREREFMIFVIDGAIELALKDKLPVRLHRGEGAITRTVAPHRVRNVGPGRARVLSVAMNPPTG
jgi:transcriptional regulator with XRE-family HTH domain